jgi:DNA-binding transcriptional ArsR family regulator
VTGRAARRTRRSAAGRSRGDVFHAVGDDTRRHILVLLGGGEQRVNDLAQPFQMTRPAVSQHLAVLRRAGLVSVRRHGRERYYRLRAARLRAVYDWVAFFEQFWPEKLRALGAYLDRQAKSVDDPRKGSGPKRDDDETD